MGWLRSCSAGKALRASSAWRAAARVLPAAGLACLGLGACGRFGFETLPDLQLSPNVGTSGDGSPGACSVGTLAHCSACGDDCAARELASVQSYACVSAACTIASCAPNFADCNQDPSDGCERALDTQSDCGACDVPCVMPNAQTSCQSGSCQLVQCVPGFGDCDGDLSNGCERPLDTLTNCGGCGVPCSAPNADVSCAGGVCQLVSCANGYDDCDGSPPTGCEARLDTLSDCGSCGTPCEISGAESLACSGGVCSAASCAPFFADCDGDSLSCETDLRTLSNCVSCGVGCGDADGRLPNATASCASGACGVGACDAGFGDCDSSPGNGCETRLDTLLDCGACNVPCTRANASETCAGGSCAILSCEPGFDDCDGVDANGCEAALGTNAHCGGCNDACGANQTCQSGSCVGQFITFQPANVDVSAPTLNTANARRDIVLDCGTVTLNTGTLSNNGWCGRPGPPLVVQAQANGPDLVVLPMRSLQIAAGTTFRVSGSRPLALVVFGDVSVAGTLDVSANGTSGGPGNHWNCNVDESSGVNGGDTTSDTGGRNGGGGGGAYAAAGGRGGDDFSEQGGAGGQPRGNALLTPLLPGCLGGWGGGCGQAPGGGGGAVELAASGTISITGDVLARGANGSGGCDKTGGATGGGSGGGILIQGNQVAISGNLNAEGGSGGGGAKGGAGGPGGTSGAGGDGASPGGGGGGSTGRVRVAGAQGCSLAGSVSPPASTSCP